MPEHKLEMVFENSLGKTSIMTIQDIQPDLPDADAVALMNAFISTDIFSPNGVTLTGIKSCVKIDSNETECYHGE